MKNRRVGKVRVICELIDKEYKDIIKAFSLLKFLPVRAEALYCSSEVEYIGISEKFDELPEGEIIPEYDLIITRDMDSIVSVNVKRKEY